LVVIVSCIAGDSRLDVHGAVADTQTLEARVAARYRELGGRRTTREYVANFDDQQESEAYADAIAALPAADSRAQTEYLVGLAHVQPITNTAGDPWLHNAEIDAAMILICNITGQAFQEATIATGALGYDNVWANCPRAVQVVQCGLNHWVAMRRRGDTVEIADSMGGAVVKDELKLHARKLFGYDEARASHTIVKVPCPAQQNPYDCGLCAIGCALEWVFGVNDLMRDPYDTDTNLMRDFVRESFRIRAFRTTFHHRGL
jgi:hypothetical protein